MEKFPDLNGLHPLAIVAFGAALAIIFVVRHLGISMGMWSLPPTDAAKAQVAAVIVDPTALNRLLDEVSNLVEAISVLIEVGKALERTQSHMAIEVDRIREELRIQREIARRG
ncbi:hypothetical protein [Shinella sp. M27]|uniref:hypothetical protein n=1 Tax=Shinella sp. M27 TaxID=3368614 RepID=UPI003BA0C0E0